MEAALIALAAAAGAVASALINVLANRARVNAEVEKLEMDAVAMMTQTNAELLASVKAESAARESRLLSRIAELEAQIEHLSAMVQFLTDQLDRPGEPPRSPRWDVP